jgi:hypothetical protein
VVFNNSLSCGSNITGVGITAHGANFLRQLEVELNKAQPGRFQKLGVRAISLLGDAGMAIAVKVLSDYLAGPVGRIAGVVVHSGPPH